MINLYLPSGNLTFAIENSWFSHQKMVIFHSFFYVYQRVDDLGNIIIHWVIPLSLGTHQHDGPPGVALRLCGAAQLYRAGSRILGASGGLSPGPRGGELRSALRRLGVCCGGTVDLHMCLRCNEDATGTHVKNWKNWKWWYLSAWEILGTVFRSNKMSGAKWGTGGMSFIKLSFMYTVYSICVPNDWDCTREMRRLVHILVYLRSVFGHKHTHSQTELCQDTCEDASAHTCDILWHPVTIPDLRTQTQKDAADQSMWFKHIQTSIKSITGNQPMTMDNSRITDDFPWIVPVEMAMECSWIYHVWWHRRGSGPSRPCWKHRHDIASCMAFWHLPDPLWGARHVVNDGYGSKLTENHRCWFIFRYFWKENIFFLGYYSYIILYNHFDQSPVCCCFASTQTSWRKVTLI